jgi:putative transposase
MSHKIRRCEPNLTYHTYSRCEHKYKLMRHNRMKELLLTVIKMAQNKYQFELMSYAIMDNHFHLIIRTVAGGAPISRIMQLIKSQYAQRYNKLMKTCGPFWNERYGHQIVEEQENPEEAFHNMNSYIMQNPVKANYVADVRNYVYSSIHFYLDESYSPPVRLAFHQYYLKLGSSFRERAEKFIALSFL